MQMARRFKRWPTLALLLAVTGFAQPSSLAAQDPAVAWEPVVVEVGGQRYDQYEARLGRIQVPEKRGKESRNIDVFFIHIRSPKPNPDPPLFVLGAGPGGSGIREAQNVIRELPGIIERRDIVGMDQRGTGRSGPNLTRELTATYPGPSDRNGLLEAYAQLVMQARRYWTAQGVDLSGYNTWEAASDLDAIRAALRAASHPLQPTEVRDQLLTSGFSEDNYNQFLPAIHVVLKRLVKSGEVMDLPNKLYWWFLNGQPPMLRSIVAASMLKRASTIGEMAARPARPKKGSK